MNKSHLLGAVCACIISLLSLSVHAVAVSGQGTWETTLQGRDLDGNAATFEAYYDTVLNITWLADANANGVITWAEANTYAADLDFGPGIDEWRLPNTVDVGNDGATYTNIFQGVDYGYNITTHSEMSHMFYETLGNLSYYDTSGTGPQTGWGLTNTGPFSYLQPDRYWSATEYVLVTGQAWVFPFDDGFQNADHDYSDRYAWAVHSGDVGAAIVPIPPAVWLFGSGLLGLIGMARRKKAA